MATRRLARACLAFGLIQALALLVSPALAAVAEEGQAAQAVAAWGDPAPAAEAPVSVEQGLPKPEARFSLVPKKRNLGLFLAAQAAVIVDMGQTLDIKHNPDLQESNPLFGSSPSDGKIFAIFGTRLALNTVAYFLLPGRWANVLQLVTIAVEIPVIARNASLGLSVSF